MKITHLLIILFANFIICAQLIAAELPKPLVETEWLVKNLQHVSILDVRDNVKSFTASPVFIKDKKTGKQTLVRVGGHIPNASLVDYKNVRGEQKINGTSIKYMLPSKAAFESLMQTAGMKNDSSIVIVTNAENEFDLTTATRMYWQIKYFGHDEVSILNGGTAQWLIDGNAVETALMKPEVGDWQAKKENQALLAGSEEVEAAIENKDIQLLDIRPLGQYLGVFKSSKVSARGHIPTAKLYPVENTASNKMPVKFSSPAELEEIAVALGVQTDSATIAYCNSGHMASAGWFVMHELLGNKNVKLYDGSMHQWTAEKRPVVKMKME